MQLMRLHYEKCMTSRAFTMPLQKVHEYYMQVDTIVKDLTYKTEQKIASEKAKMQNLI